MPRTSFLLLCLFCIFFELNAQRATNNFRHLTTNEGLSNEIVNGIARDKYGFMWFGSAYGINRFDGLKIKTWYHDPKDSLSLANNFIRTLFGDRSGRIWIGADPGFCEYDYSRDQFIRYANAQTNIQDIEQDSEGEVWVATSKGLKRVDTVKKTLIDIEFTTDSTVNKIFVSSIRDIQPAKGGDLYLATGRGVLLYNSKKNSLKLISKETLPSVIQNNDISAITIDSSDNLWMAVFGPSSKLYKLNMARNQLQYYDYFVKQGNQLSSTSIGKLYTDRKGRVWIGSNYIGLSFYDPRTDEFETYNTDVTLPNSINGEYGINFYQDPAGVFWSSSPGYGVDYFNPDQDIFLPIQKNKYLQQTLSSKWVRNSEEDPEGNLWLALAKGVFVLDKQLNISHSFLNQDTAHPDLQSLSVRSLYNDGQYMWMGTANGVSRYQYTTHRTELLGEKDSLPRVFTWFITKTKAGKLLVGNNRGLFEYVPAKKNFYDYANHPVLKDFHFSLRCFYEDSRGYWWIGTFSNGVVVYDPVKNKVIRQLLQDSSRYGLSSNFPHDIKEDKRGNIWISSRLNLNCYDRKKDSVIHYSTQNGLPTSWLGAIRVDSLDRIWISSNRGLIVINQERKVETVFGLQDGLVTTQFNDQTALAMKDGRFAFPSFGGLLIVNPLNYNWKEQLPVPYITAFNVLSEKEKKFYHLEEQKRINLGPSENFFSLELIGLNHANPEQVWYSYKLEGFDEDWIHSKDRIVNYTNVPGGHYTFRYKVSFNPNFWEVEEKTLEIWVATRFYNTWWFRVIASLLLLSAIISFYKYRIRQKEMLLDLETKAQMLEKEKAMVMYENLKQQLNPHFLFNSLTSLSSLIKVDQKTAGNFLDSLSKTYRYILKNRDAEMVPLADEIKFAESYCKLQQTRFNTGLLVDFQIDPASLSGKIVPVTLQNMIENAIKHNVIDKDTPLQIRIFTEGEYIVISNNLQKKNFVETSNKQGLANLVSLYKYLSKHPVKIDETNNQFTIKIPLL